MQRYQLGYRHAPGEVEGFIRYAFTAAYAKEAAIEQIRAKLGPAFDAARVLTNPNECTRSEFKQLKTDWRVIRELLKNRGASIY